MTDVEEKTPRKVAGKGVVLPAATANNMMCKACNKRVYELEKMVMGDVIYHKTCFRCQTCNSVLKLNNFGAANGKNFCKPHFIEAFKVKGNYSAGFADNDEEEKAKSKKTSDVKPLAEKPANGSNGIKANGSDKLHTDEHASVLVSDATSVSRSEDGDELPAEGTTRQRMALLKQLTEDRQEPTPRTKTSPTEETAPTNVTRNMMKKFESLNAGGDAKNQATISAAEEDHEKPAADTTRNLLAKFRSMEDPSRAPPNPQTTAEHHHKTTAVEAKRNDNEEEEEETASSGHDIATHTHHAAAADVEEAYADGDDLELKDDASDHGDAVGEEVGGSEELDFVNDRHEVEEEVDEHHGAGGAHHEVHHEYEDHEAHHLQEAHHHDDGREAHHYDARDEEEVEGEAEEEEGEGDQVRCHNDSDEELDAPHHKGQGHVDDDDM